MKTKLVLALIYCNMNLVFFFFFFFNLCHGFYRFEIAVLSLWETCLISNNPLGLVFYDIYNGKKD
jgi:hypothetical protein